MKAMNKEDALKRIEAIENEAQELKKIINKKSDWRDIIDFESACDFFGKKANDLVGAWKNAGLTLSQINGLKLEMCIRAVNTDENGKTWIPDWLNTNQYKWYNWFEKKSSGWRFYGSNFHHGYSFLGSGFYFETEEKAKHGAKHFKAYYEIWLG